MTDQWTDPARLLAIAIAQVRGASIADQRNINDTAQAIADATEEGVTIPKQVIENVLSIAFFRGMCHCMQCCQKARADGTLEFILDRSPSEEDVQASLAALLSRPGPRGTTH